MKMEKKVDDCLSERPPTDPTGIGSTAAHSDQLQGVLGGQSKQPLHGSKGPVPIDGTGTGPRTVAGKAIVFGQKKNVQDSGGGAAAQTLGKKVDVAAKSTPPAIQLSDSTERRRSTGS